MGKEFTNTIATTDGGTYKQASVGAASQSPLTLDKYASTLISQESQAAYGKVQDYYGLTSTTLSETAQAATNAVVVSLATGWLGISAFKPARTEGASKVFEKVKPDKPELYKYASTDKADTVIDRELLKYTLYDLLKAKGESPQVQRYERKNLCSVQLGEYSMPLSQTFNLRAKKRLNVCSLVDGIDIIQQTRHEAKVIDCSLRVTLRTNQPNLEIISQEQRRSGDPYKDKGATKDNTTQMIRSLTTFSKFLAELYENDAVFAIDNQVINDVFGVEYAIISEYSFLPQVGRGTFQFNFTLTEVKIGDDTLTFDVREIGGSNA